MEEIIARSGAEIGLGRWGENLARCVVFDISHWQKTYGEGTVQLLHQRCGDSAPYPCVIQVTGAQVRWEVTETDVALPGRGSAELQYYVGETRVKSETYHTRARQALSGTGPVPDAPEQSWVDRVLEAGAAADIAAGAAEKAMAAAGQAQEAAAYVEEEIAKLGELDSGRIIALEQRTDRLEEAVGTTTGSLAERVDEHDGTLDDLTGRTASLEQQMADLLYEPISITSFSHNTGTREKGETVTAVNLTWAINKTPVTLTLDGEELGVSVRSRSVTGLNITAGNSGTKWTLTATDERGAAAQRSTSAFTFLNCVYYGMAAQPETVDSAFVRSLGTKTAPTSTRARTITLAGDGTHVWYCLPTGLGRCTFTSGGFPAGIELADTIAFTNALGYTENYYVYRSNQCITDTVTIGVS